MRRLTKRDIENIVGSTVKGYRVEAARIKDGPYTDSDHYGFILGRNVFDGEPDTPVKAEITFVPRCDTW